jgi:hypothetical protein
MRLFMKWILKLWRRWWWMIFMRLRRLRLRRKSIIEIDKKYSSSYIDKKYTRLTDLFITCIQCGTFEQLFL